MTSPTWPHYDVTHLTSLWRQPLELIMTSPTWPHYDVTHLTSLWRHPLDPPCTHIDVTHLNIEPTWEFYTIPHKTWPPYDVTPLTPLWRHPLDLNMTSPTWPHYDFTPWPQYDVTPLTPIWLHPLDPHMTSPSWPHYDVTHLTSLWRHPLDLIMTSSCTQTPLDLIMYTLDLIDLIITSPTWTLNPLENSIQFRIRPYYISQRIRDPIGSHKLWLIRVSVSSIYAWLHMWEITKFISWKLSDESWHTTNPSNPAIWPSLWS